MKKAIKAIAINGLVLLGLIIVVELIFGSWFEPTKFHLNIIRRNAQDVNYYPWQKEVVIYTRDQHGFRGSGIANQPETIDILAVGGSTTDEVGVTDSLTWTALLEKKLKKDGKNLLIANAGISAQSTIGHIKNFEIWFPQIENLRPKYILFYVGINDYIYIWEKEKGLLGEATEKGLRHPNVAYHYYLAIVFRVRQKSIFYHVYKRIHGYLLAKQFLVYEGGVKFNTLEYVDTTTVSQKHLQIFKEGLESFEKRLQVLISYSEKIGAEPIFITQPTMFYRFDHGKLYGLRNVTRHFKYPHSGVDYYHMLNLLNETIRGVCADKYSVVELTSLPIWRNRISMILCTLLQVDLQK